MFEFTEENATESETVTMSEPDFEDVPSEDISCVPWIYDASKFQTSGKACTMDDYIDEMMAAYEY